MLHYYVISFIKNFFCWYGLCSVKKIENKAIAHWRNQVWKSLIIPQWQLGQFCRCVHRYSTRHTVCTNFFGGCALRCSTRHMVYTSFFRGRAHRYSTHLNSCLFVFVGCVGTSNTHLLSPPCPLTPLSSCLYHFRPPSSYLSLLPPTRPLPPLVCKSFLLVFVVFCLLTLSFSPPSSTPSLSDLLKRRFHHDQIGWQETENETIMDCSRPVASENETIMHCHKPHKHPHILSSWGRASKKIFKKN